MLLLWDVTGPHHPGLSPVLGGAWQGTQRGWPAAKSFVVLEEAAGRDGLADEVSCSPSVGTAGLPSPAAPLGWLVTSISFLVGTGKGWRVREMWGGLVAAVRCWGQCKGGG